MQVLLSMRQLPSIATAFADYCHIAEHYYVAEHCYVAEHFQYACAAVSTAYRGVHTDNAVLGCLIRVL